MQEHPTSLPAGRAMAAPAPKNPMGYTVAEVAEILGKHPNTIYAWIHDGPLADAKRQIGGTFYIPRRAVRALLDLEDNEATDLVTAPGGEVA
jgi:excisionase family DNA binding protein